jgi:hypothetical protein
MARGIATRALAGGKYVTLLGRKAGDADALAAELDGQVRAGKVGDPRPATSSCWPLTPRVGRQYVPERRSVYERVSTALGG